jgi:hypothetical protein
MKYQISDKKLQKFVNRVFEMILGDFDCFLQNFKFIETSDSVRRVLFINTSNISESKCRKIFAVGKCWYKRDKLNRRYVIVPSIDINWKLSNDIFEVSNWSLAEYRDLVKSEKFWMSVCDVFNDDGSANYEERLGLIERKYFYAGSNVGLMFNFGKDGIANVVYNSSMIVDEYPMDYLYSHSGTRYEYCVERSGLFSAFASRKIDRD